MLLFIQFFSGNKEFLFIIGFDLRIIPLFICWLLRILLLYDNKVLHNSFSLSNLRPYPSHLLKSYSSFSLSNIRSYYYCSSSNRMSCFSCSLSNLRFYFPRSLSNLRSYSSCSLSNLRSNSLIITNLRSYSLVHYLTLGPTLLFII